MQYFTDRAQAGNILADKMTIVEPENTAIVALSEGAVLVGAELSKRFGCPLYFLATEDITLPNEVDTLATASVAGLTYNTALSPGQLEEIKADYHSVIDQESLEAFHKINRIVGKDGAVNKHKLKGHTVILVSDGLINGLSLDVSADFMKPIKVKKLVIATPIASIPATDQMHLLGDQIFCLGILPNYISTDHYYDDNNIPDHKTVVDIMKNSVPSA